MYLMPQKEVSHEEMALISRDFMVDNFVGVIDLSCKDEKHLKAQK